MSVTRRTVLELLAATSDATRQEKTSIGALAATLDTEERTVEAHLDGLEACDLARVEPDGAVRVTVTGEELLALDTDELIVVDAATSNSE